MLRIEIERRARAFATIDSLPILMFNFHDVTLCGVIHNARIIINAEQLVITPDTDKYPLFDQYTKNLVLSTELIMTMM